MKRGRCERCGGPDHLYMPVTCEYEEWVPITESGERWAPRSQTEAEDAMAAWPAGGTYGDGQPYDGIVRLERRSVVIEYGPWEPA